MSKSSDRAPVADQAEFDAWFPSPYSLTQYVPPETDFDGADYPNAYKGGKWKILTIGTQERYLKMDGGEFFSTGNHPVEMLLPMLHLDKAGFEIDVATISGDPVKFEKNLKAMMDSVGRFIDMSRIDVAPTSQYCMF